MTDRHELNMRKAERLHSKPYRFYVVGNNEQWFSKYYPTRAKAIKAIREIRKKGYTVTKFRNEWTGNNLKLP